MIEAPSAADVTFSRTSGSHATALSAGSRHPRKWRLALELRTQADPATTARTVASSSCSVQPHKLGQYHCWNRVYDINTARWTSPDPAASPWWNAFDFIACNPQQGSDPTGLGQTVIVGTKLERKGEVERDHKSVEKYQDAFADNSHSIQDFYAILSKKYFDCRHKSGRSKSECCIEKLVLAGHSGAGFGGREQEMSDEVATGISTLLCPGATIINYQCWGGCVGWHKAPTDSRGLEDDDFHERLGDEIAKTSMKYRLLSILKKVGGSYQGYSGHTAYPEGCSKPWENEPPRRFPGVWKEIKVPKGATWKELRDANPPEKARGVKSKLGEEEESF